MTNLTKSEKINIVYDIVNRADVTYPNKIDKMSLEMDIFCVHNSIGLDLNGLLKADDFNFGHDIIGIMLNLNRATGKLDNFFLPRFSRNS